MQPSAPSRLPRDSCLIVYVQDNRQCFNCDIPVLGKIRINNPKMNADKTISYKLRFKPGEFGGPSGYSLTATLNMGWCKNNDEWIRYGDYNNDYSHTFYMQPDRSDAYRDIKINLYQDAKSKNTSGRCLKGLLSYLGDILFTPSMLLIEAML